LEVNQDSATLGGMRSYGQYCSVAKALDVIGDRWTLLIVRELLLQGPCRYTDLKNGLPGIATNLLSDRLRELEAAGLVRREEAAPPVATTLFRLTEAGAGLEPALDALGTWGIRYMADPADDDEFRSQWFAFPVSLFLHDSDPDGPPLSIELRPGGRPAVVEISGGEIRTRLGDAPSPDLVLEGPPRIILGLLSARLTPAEARDRGLTITGDSALLRRLQPQPAPPPTEPAPA
jgi:DNA-binding HxlR family transcriptional regulator